MSAISQLSVLKEMLSNILKTVHPSVDNLNAFGANIRNLLILSSIETETQLKGILSNHEATPKIRYSTTDYIKLRYEMNLAKYDVKLRYYPELPIISPFKKWDFSAPTASLHWYDSYNALKHNGETEYKKASLLNAITAVCAVSILIAAQYGQDHAYWLEQVGSYFEIIDRPTWKIGQFLLPPFKGHEICTCKAQCLII